MSSTAMRLTFRWIAANTLAWAAAVVVLLVFDRLWGCIAGGAIVGAAQWFALRRHLRLPLGWIAGTCFAWSVGIWVGETHGFIAPDPLWAGAVGGTLAGSVQTWALWRRVQRPALWFPASVVSSTLGWLAASAVSSWDWAGGLLTGIAVLGAVMGLASAPVLLWMRRHPKQAPDPQPLFPLRSWIRMSALIFICLFCLGVPRASAGTPPAEIQWNELAALIIGHNVSIPLAEGEFVEGEALSVRDGSLMVDIVKTSDASRYPKGQTSIPRNSVTEVRVKERRGAGGRILGTAVGALTGVVAGAEIAAHGPRSEAAIVSTFSAVAIACTVGGYYAGRMADRHVKVYRIARGG